MNSLAFLIGIAMPAMIVLPPAFQPGPSFMLARASCKQVGSCEEAVALWCNGYTRADSDSDGIPCENVCHSLEQVEEIKSRQGC
jgi:hypothetical protein